MKQPTLLIPLTRTGSSPTLGEQRHAECPNTGKPLLSTMRVVGTLKIMHFACLTDRRGCPPKVGGRAKRRGYETADSAHTPHPYRELPYLRGAAPCGMSEHRKAFVKHHADCQNAENSCTFDCLTDRRDCPPKVGGRAKRRGYETKNVDFSTNKKQQMRQLEVHTPPP